MTICILESKPEVSPHDPAVANTVAGLTRFTNTLAKTLEKHLKMNVIRTTMAHDSDSEIVIVPELSFEYLASIRRSRPEGRKAPVTIFVAMDALEAATLRSDARVSNKESVVEIMTQPYVRDCISTVIISYVLMIYRCGPFKLAYILNHCLDRFAAPGENLRHQTSGSEVSLHMMSKPSERPTTSPRNIATEAQTTESDVTQMMHDTTISEHAPFPATTSPALEPNDAPSAASQVLIVDDNSINRSASPHHLKQSSSFANNFHSSSSSPS